MSMAEVREGLAMMRAGYATLAAASMDPLTATELLEVGDELETLTCQLPTQRHRMLTRLQAETTARALGAKSWHNVLTVRWRLSSAEAGRRLTEAALLGPRRGLTGEPLDPQLPATSAAVAADCARSMRKATTLGICLAPSPLHRAGWQRARR